MKKIYYYSDGALEPWSLNEKIKKIALILYQKRSWLILMLFTAHLMMKKNIKELMLKLILSLYLMDTSQLFQKIDQVPKKEKHFSFQNSQKREFLIIDVWKLLKPKNWEFHIFGPEGDKTFKEIKKFVKNNNLSDAIYFHDPVFLKTKKRYTSIMIF